MDTFEVDGYDCDDVFTGVCVYISSCIFKYIQFGSDQLLSRVWFFVTPFTTALQASLSITKSRSPPKLMSIKSVMPSNRLILRHPLLLLPSIFPSFRVCVQCWVKVSLKWMISPPLPSLFLELLEIWLSASAFLGSTPSYDGLHQQFPITLGKIQICSCSTMLFL